MKMKQPLFITEYFICNLLLGTLGFLHSSVVAIKKYSSLDNILLVSSFRILSFPILGRLFVFPK